MVLTYLGLYISKNKKELKLSASDLGFLFTIGSWTQENYFTDNYLCQKQLSKELNIDERNVRRHFNKIKKTNLVILTFHPNDRRKKIYSIDYDLLKNGI